MNDEYDVCPEEGGRALAIAALLKMHPPHVVARMVRELDEGEIEPDTTLDGMGREIHSWARSKGFYDRERLRVVDSVTGDVEGRPVNPSLPSEKLMLIVTEVAEIQEALRDGDTENEAEEVADVLIRLLDYAAWRGIKLDRAVGAKMGKNHGRPYLHGRAEF